MDLAKYRRLFLEEGRENLGQLSEALLALEKDAAAADAIDHAFRAAHSVKGMAATVGYEATAELAHRLEDRLDGCRAAGHVDPAAIALLFEGLEGLEQQLRALEAGGEEPPAPTELLQRLAESPGSAAEPPASDTETDDTEIVSPPPGEAAAERSAEPPKKARRRP